MRQGLKPLLEEARGQFKADIAVALHASNDGRLGVLVSAGERSSILPLVNEEVRLTDAVGPVAPREFDEGIIKVLSRAASLVAGAIENASLYEEARRRVESLTRLSELGRETASVSDRASLYRVTTTGVRGLLNSEVCLLYEYERDDGRLRRVASDPQVKIEQSGEEESLVLRLLESSGRPSGSALKELARTLQLGESPMLAQAVTLIADGHRIGALVVAGREHWSEAGAELLQAAAQQLALAIEKIDLIERLTEENLARDLFDALANEHPDLAAGKATTAGIELSRPHIVLEVRPRPESGDDPWADRAGDIELAIRRALPATICDITPVSLRALTPANGEGVEPARGAIEKLARTAADEGLAIGVSEAHRGLSGLSQAFFEARDATTIAGAMGAAGQVVLYRDTGAYRYLIGLLDSGGPQDHLRSAVELIVDYDRERRAHLLRTLDEYLAQGGSIAGTARALYIHGNTLRQRLRRIETLTGISLEDEDLLALQLAVKLALVRRPDPG